MTNITACRNPGTIAAEINYIKRKVQETVIYASIEIGGKLCEAKSMVSQGEWGSWLEQNVEYSQSTAENLMKLYREYGGNQESLFDTWTNSETFGKLTYTQHLALLALPFADRQEFAEENAVVDMSTRQLQKAIQDQLDEECRNHEKTREDLVTTQAQLRDAQQNVLNMQQQLSSAKSSEDAWQEQINKLTAAKHLAETGEKNASQKVEVLEKQLKDAQKKQREIRAELKKAQENPTVPESLMEQLRQEAEEAAARKTAGDLEKQLQEARAALEREQEKTRSIEEKLVAVQKKTDPDMVECNVIAQKLRTDFNSLLGWVKKISVGDKEKGEKMLKFLRLLVKAWAEALGMEVK